MAKSSDPVVKAALIGLVGTLGAALITAGALNGWFTSGDNGPNPEASPTTPRVITQTPLPAEPPLGETTGPWTATAGGVEAVVTSVERVRNIGDGKVLRFHVAITNETTSSIDLPLGFFVATDQSGNAYEAELFDSDWSTSVPSGLTVAGSILLGEVVSGDASVMTISFGEIFGRDAPSSGLTVQGIAVP
jgi:hypothetical protein